MVEALHQASDDESQEPPRFPLSSSDLELLKGMAAKIRELLPRSHPACIRRAAVALISLERLPKVTPGAAVTVGWRTARVAGSWEWADISISEEDVRATVGAHVYDPDVGGDTESETIFCAYVDGGSHGDLDEWARRAERLADENDLTVEDEWAGEDHIDWQLHADEHRGS